MQKYFLLLLFILNGCTNDRSLEEQEEARQRYWKDQIAVILEQVARSTGGRTDLKSLNKIEDRRLQQEKGSMAK